MCVGGGGVCVVCGGGRGCGRECEYMQVQGWFEV